MKKTLIGLLLLVALLGCKPGATEIAVTSPFIGGTQGIEINFQDFRAEVFDGGLDPFDIIVHVENKGETAIPRQKAEVQISGINPFEFGKDVTQLKRTLPDDLIETRKMPEGQILESPPLFVEFTGLNHVSRIAGATATYPIRADVCYWYKTTAVGEMCIRERLLNPGEGGICEPTGPKQVFSSGAPIQIQNLQQVVRSKDKIGFSFDIVNAGTGNVYERDSKCDKQNRMKENKVYITINSGLPGLQCTGLGAGNAGFVTMYGGTKTISCTQMAASTTDFKQLMTIEATYDYEQTTETSLTVKSAGE